jgi:hypothetical protein
VGIRGSFPGVKWLAHEADYSPPSSAEVKEWVALYLHSPNTPSWRGAQLKHRGNFTFCLLWICWIVGRTPWAGERPDARPPPTQDNTTQKNVDIHPCLEWDSNLRTQCSSGRRQYLLQTALPLGPA